jgi:hypothetical protein
LIRRRSLVERLINRHRSYVETARMGFHQRFARSCGRTELLIRCGLILDYPDVPPGRGRTLPVPRLFSEMFKLTLLPSAPKRTTR